MGRKDDSSSRHVSRRAAVKLPAPGNKSDTGEGRCHFEACNSSASSQCWPRCAPQGLLLLWGAIEGLGRHPPLRGKPFHRPHTVAKRTRLLCYGCRAMALPVVFVIYCPVADAVRHSTVKEVIDRTSSQPVAVNPVTGRRSGFRSRLRDKHKRSGSFL